VTRSFRIALGAAIIGIALVASLACGDDEEPSEGGYPDEVELTDADNGASVKLADGGTLVISLESNPSTGFAWTIAEPAPSQLESQGDPVYVPPAETTPIVGAPGTEVFTLTAAAAGTAELKLEYRRSFEPDVPAEKTFAVTVEIK
jgi:inhibitor of cysteine peptidase